MKYGLLTLAALLLAGCAASLPTPIADNETGNRLSGLCYKGAQAALAGDESGWHDGFFAAYSRARDPMLGGEDLESIRETLGDLLARSGDESFATALAKETPPVRSGAAYFLSGISLDVYPKTKALVTSTPDYDFELEKASRGS